MVSLPVKALIGLGIAGAIGGGGYGIYTVVKKEETILDALTNKKFSFLNTTGTADDGEWDNKVNAYKTKQAGDPSLNDYIEKTDGSEEDNKLANRSKMKEICESLVRESAKDSEKLKQAEKWCTKDKTPPQ